MHLLDRQDGQLHELPPGRTTIGSSPKCTLRLERPGVQPLHCLIVHGPEGVSVRRWAPDARLNGMPFDDASIEAGDCLAIGGVEFELVTDTVDSVETPTEAAAETFLDETDTSCSRLMDAVQESVEAITELETMSESEAAEVEPADEVIETLEVAEADDIDSLGDEGGTDEVGEANDIRESTEACVAIFEAMPARIEQTVSAAQAADEAAEIVFRELQAACAVARGRTRRMLMALRRERQQNRDLLERLTEVGKQLALLKLRSPAGESSDGSGATEFLKWQTQWEEFRKQFAVWEAKLVEHTQQMAELQLELVTASNYQPMPAESSTARRPDTTVVIPAGDAEATQADLTEPFAFSNALPATSGASSADADSEFAQTSEVLNAVRKSLWVEAGIPRVENATSAFDPLPQADEPSTKSEASAEQSSAASEESPYTWEKPAPAASSVSEGDQLSAPNDTDPWAVPTAESDWATKKAAGVFAEPAVRKSVWTMPPLPAADDVNRFNASDDASAIEVEAPTWASETSAESAAGEDEASPFAEFSIWKQGASAESATQNDSVENESADNQIGTEAAAAWESEVLPEREATEESQPIVDTPFEAKARACAEEVVVPEPVSEIAVAKPVSPRKSQPASFIDQYSHLFEENAAEVLPTSAPVEQPSFEKPEAKVGGFADSHGAANAEFGAQSEDEESIEQYMAKLMQRVRGESATSGAASPTAAPQPSVVTTVAKLAVAANPVAIATPEVGNSNQVQVETTTPAQNDQPTDEPSVDWDAIARRAAAAAPKADMGALRALANETARRAIGRHALQKHRRDAVTKVIVSSLAGMTSLWLMLDSPSWRDIQFITACVSLVAAAYWAGETFREMLESLRAAAYQGSAKPDDDAGSEPEDAQQFDKE